MVNVINMYRYISKSRNTSTCKKNPKGFLKLGRIQIGEICNGKTLLSQANSAL